MNRIERSSAHPISGGAAGLKIYAPPAAPDDRNVYVDVPRPGRYRLRGWTELEWASMDPGERPETWCRKGSVWMSLEADEGPT